MGELTSVHAPRESAVWTITLGSDLERKSAENRPLQEMRSSTRDAGPVTTGG